MNITVERQSKCEAQLRVEIPGEAVKGERQKIVQAFSRQARIKGFRPGHIPKAVIEKRFGEQIAEELESRLMQQAYQEAVQKEDLRILDAKRPENRVELPDGGLSFSSALTLAPEFDLPEYKGINLEIPDRQVEESDIEGELDGLRNRFAEFEDIADRPLASGDFAVIDYSSQLDGKPLEEAIGQSVGYLGGAEGYWLKMEEDSLIPGFTEAIEGSQIDEERDFSLTVPEEFPVEELRGIELDFHAKITGVKTQTLPEVNDAFAEQILPGKGLDDLRGTIREQLEAQLTRQIDEFKVNQLLEKLNAAVSFDLPPDLLTAETQGQADELVERGMGSGMSEDEIESQQGEIFAAASQRAQMNLRTDFLLQRISEEEEIQVTKEELTHRVAALAQQAKKPVKAFAKELQQSGRLRGLQHSMLLSKTIDFLLEHANVETTEHIPGAEEEAPAPTDEAPEAEIVSDSEPAAPAEDSEDSQTDDD